MWKKELFNQITEEWRKNMVSSLVWNLVLLITEEEKEEKDYQNKYPLKKWIFDYGGKSEEKEYRPKI